MKEMVSLGLKYQKNKLYVLDQRMLPHHEVWVECIDSTHMVDLIKTLAIRGAPLIGIAAALSIANDAVNGAHIDKLITSAKLLRTARPTAVNLMAAVDRLILSKNPAALSIPKIVEEAENIFFEDIELCKNMAQRASQFISDGDSVITHCNTGGLVTAGIGTALGAIRMAHESGKKVHVFVDETRPLLQGARLTTWELDKLNIPYTLICDNMAGFLMSQKKAHKVFVGADRIARNGDFANKIGTYSLAILAKHHNIPFYVVAPYTTYDENCMNGSEIPVEERSHDEVRAGKSVEGCHVWNPAFDVTPREMISGVVLDNKII